MRLSEAVRQYVRERAGHCCEYCRVLESGRLSRLHVDHIIARKYGGTNDDDNLCLACYKCNGYKGSHIAAVDPATGSASKLYHPRQQIWKDHFKLNTDATIAGLTPEGRTTIVVLRINDKARAQTRYLAMLAGKYPC